MSEVPDSALLPLGRDNALWLHEFADRFFAGDVAQAHDAVLTYARTMIEGPQDPWAPLERLQRQRPGIDGTPHT